MKGTYSLDGISENKCTICLDNFICSGGYVPIYPKAGYWRESKTSLNAIQCIHNKQACLEHDRCLDGYRGVLCENCNIEIGYYIIGSYACASCANMTSIIFMLIIL